MRITASGGVGDQPTRIPRLLVWACVVSVLAAFSASAASMAVSPVPAWLSTVTFIAYVIAPVSIVAVGAWLSFGRGC